MNSAVKSDGVEAERAHKRACDLLANATMSELQQAWAAHEPKPDVTPLRGPETGLVMVRGRIGGGGDPFNLGEITVSRASVRLDCGSVGHGQTLGTSREKSRLAAIFDALWQRPDLHEEIERKLLLPVAERLAAEDRKKAEETAATRVDFFTMVRGED